MSTAVTVSHDERKPEHLGQTVIVIGGSAGIGLETARRARTKGAKLILTGRNPEPLQRAGQGCVEESGGDQVDSNGRELLSEMAGVDAENHNDELRVVQRSSWRGDVRRPGMVNMRSVSGKLTRTGRTGTPTT